MTFSSARVRLPRPQDREVCVHAEDFSVWVRDLLDRVDLKDRLQVHHAILQLTLQYYQWYFQVPQTHQVRVGSKGHVCIFHVFMHGLNDLIKARDNLDPPTYVPPPPPPRIERIEVPVPMIPSFSDQGSLLGLSFGSRNEMD